MSGNEKHDLDKIRLKKLKAIMEAQKRQQQVQDQVGSIQDKVIHVLKIVLSPEAFEHLMRIQSAEPKVYQAIFNELVTPEVIQNIDYLINVLQQRQMRGGVSRKIPLDVIIMLERKAKGIKGKIQVRRDGETMDLGNFLSGQ